MVSVNTALEDSMNVDEVASLLHFGAERVGPDYPQLRKVSVKPEPSFPQQLTRTSSTFLDVAQRKMELEEEIRIRRMELENLSGRGSPSFSGNSKVLPETEGNIFVDNNLIDLDKPCCSKAPAKAEKGFSAEQLTELVKIFKTLQPGSSCYAAEKAQESTLIDLAPRFDLKKADASWKAFEVFFDVNQVTKDELKFKILNSKLPWKTMEQYGRENPNSGRDLKKLELFLKAYAKKFTPSMYHRDSIGKYGSGSLLRDVIHEAKTIADLDRGERIKLHAYFLSTGFNQSVVKSYMHLPVEQFFSKVSQKWNDRMSSSKPNSEYMGRRSPPQPSRVYRNTVYNNRQNLNEDLCYYHDRFGKDAFKCKGSDCKMWGTISKPTGSSPKKQTSQNSSRPLLGN